ncbi:patatin-like phospholipase family protein [Candidatus Parabeggiatoa sp. HSG14]|uniref:patatin-like phospholipase family protein n=1 Tax=Candidatus Parabeggiatoa sp. HSG14 TaxID=3055593 RepID=UPI0025A758B9|nr:patatin-like phospholipase family protein [Thiotrichales bacterium HSG14]
MNNTKPVKRIAIACQGGGSHTAFTAGVLTKILEETEHKFKIVALSGTSGGAICAALTWYGLLTEDRAKAIQLLKAFWYDNTANSSWEMFFNDNLLATIRLADLIPLLPTFNPNLYPSLGQNLLKQLLEKYIDFGEIEKLLEKKSDLMCLIGAVNVLKGEFKVFKNQEITGDTILASAAVPALFKAVHIGEEAYWDGLFSQNPPVRELTTTNPDEIWIIKVEPRTIKKVPTTMEAVRDRRNELTGNLSLEQELYFIQKINEFIVKYPEFAKSKYKPIEVRQIEMLRDLDYASKVDRNPTFINDLKNYGEKQATLFFQQLE